MWSKVKHQLFHSRRREPVPVPVQLTARDLDHATRDEIKMLIAVLNEKTHEFGPMVPAVSGLLKCIESFEQKQVEAYQDHKQLWTGLRNLLLILSERFRETTYPSTMPSLLHLARGIEKETKLALRKEQDIAIEGNETFTKDIDDVLECFLRVQTLLGRFMLNENASMWKITDEGAIQDNPLHNIPHSAAAIYHSIEPKIPCRNGCTPNTRMDVLNELHDWARFDNSPKIRWLNGMAGTGKTTIAYSLCHYLDNAGQLGANFFCSRQLPACHDVRRIISSISYQLSLFSRPFRSTVFAVLEQDPQVYTQSLAQQFEKLIAVPLRKVGYTFMSTPVIVVDALDECKDREGVDELLGSMVSQVHDLRVKIIVTSRPAPNIVDRMRSERCVVIPVELRLDELDHWVIRKDINTYLTVELEHLQLSAATLDRLSEKSGLWFTYAASIVRSMGRENPPSEVEQSPPVRDGILPEHSINQQIDTFYTAVLAEAFDDIALEGPQKAVMMLVLHMVACTQGSVTVQFVAGLMGFGGVESLHAMLKPLSSVLRVSSAGLVVALHGSLRDYILDQSRSNIFYCDPGKHNSRLARLCFNLIQAIDPPFNICNLESSYLVDREVPNLDDRVKKAISDELFYACRSLGDYTELAQTSVEFVRVLQNFLSSRLLLWMEILNLKHYLHEGIGILSKIQIWSKRNNCPEEVQRLLDDGRRFVMEYSSSPVSDSTPHIYVSALPFWPKSRPISTCYTKRMTGLIGVRGTAKGKRGFASLGVFATGSKTRCFAYSPDGAYIVSGGNDQTVRIWDAHTGQQSGRSLKGHRSTVMSVAYSPSGARIVSGSADQTIRIWNANSRRLVGRPLVGHIGAVWSVVYSPDGEYLASCSDDETIRIWDALTGEPVGRPLRGHKGAVWSVAYSPDGARIASGSLDKTIRIWDAHTGKSIGRRLNGHTDSVWAVAYSPDGRHIVSGSYDKTVRIWDAYTRQQVGPPLVGHNDSVWSVAYSPDGAYIVSGSFDKTIRTWDSRTGRPAGHPLEGHADSVCSVAYSPDGAHIASGSDDKTIRTWDAYTSQSVKIPPKGHTTAVWSVAYSPDGAHVVSGSHGNTARIWDARTGRPAARPLKSHTDAVSSVAYSPNGAYIASGSYDKTVRIWDAHTGKPIGQPLLGHKYAVCSVAYSPDGAHIISSSYDNTIRVWNTYHGRQVGGPITGHQDVVWSVAYSPNGDRFASCSADETIRIWDAQTRQPVGGPLAEHTGAVWCIAYSPDGARIVSGSWDSSIRIWDAYTGQLLAQPFRGHVGAVGSVAYSPDGAHVVSGSDDHTVRVWDVHSGQTVGRPLTGHTGRISSVAYSPDGTYIVSGSHDNCILISDPGTHQKSTNLAGSHGTPIKPLTAESLSARFMSPAPTPGQSQDHWALNEHGWLVDAHDRPIVWVPVDVRGALLYPGCIARIYSEGELKLDYTTAYLGEQWGRCYLAQ